jgi:hypothetical protein
MKKEVREDPAYPAGVGVLDERGGGEESVTMVGVCEWSSNSTL